jgi:multidrug efflux pump
VSDAEYDVLDQLAGQLIGKAMGSGRFMFLRKSIDFTKPRVRMLIDRDRAGALGVSMQDIGQGLATLVGDGYVNRFSLAGRSYKVIPQVEQAFRPSTEALADYHVRSASGELVPLSNLVRFEQQVEPSKRTQFQQLNSVTVEGLMMPGVSMGDALGYLQTEASAIFPPNVRWDYAGQARQFMQQGTALVTTFFLSLLVIYLVLAAQFESWRDPLIILVSVPMSIAGALIFVSLGFASINIYTQVGLITLIGLIAKNGILIVEFANQLRAREGLDIRAAVEQAATVRLRPILMTTVAMIVAMVPLLIAAGPGAVSRFDIGLVITTGLGIGTLFTLFVVPAVYLKLARRERPEAAGGAA